MSDRGWKREEPDSPCKQVCVIHPKAGICLGCHRTADEVRDWAKYPRETRLEIIDALPGREKLLRVRRGGRRARR